MKVQIASDLCISDGQTNWKDYIEKSCDILVLAGNVAHLEGNQESYEQILKEISENFRSVYLVPGLLEFSCKKWTTEYIHAVLRIIERAIPNLHILYNDCIDVENNIRFFGTPLWYPANINVNHIQSYHGRGGTSAWFKKNYYSCLYMMEEAKFDAKKDNVKLIVITSFKPPVAECGDVEHWFYGGSLTENINIKGNVVSNQYTQDNYNEKLVVEIS